MFGFGAFIDPTLPKVGDRYKDNVDGKEYQIDQIDRDVSGNLVVHLKNLGWKSLEYLNKYFTATSDTYKKCKQWAKEHGYTWKDEI